MGLEVEQTTGSFCMDSQFSIRGPARSNEVLRPGTVGCQWLHQVAMLPGPSHLHTQTHTWGTILGKNPWRTGLIFHMSDLQQYLCHAEKVFWSLQSIPPSESTRVLTTLTSKIHT